MRCKILFDQFFVYADMYEIDLIAFVIMPDHFHVLIWPKKTKTAIDYIRGVKSFSAKAIGGVPRPRIEDGIPKTNGVPRPRMEINIPKTNGVPRKIWQSSYFDYVTISKKKIFEKIEYIKMNPVKAGLVQYPEKYPWVYVCPDYVSPK